MSSRRFYVANILSALVWAPSHILPGALVGAVFGLFGPAAEPLAIITVLVAVVIWAMAHIVRFALQRGVPAAVAAGQRLRIRLGHVDSVWVQAIASLLDRSRPEAKGLARLAALLLGGAWLFLGVLEDVVSGDPLIRADASIYQALQALRTAPGDAVMIAITELGDTVVVASVTIIVFLWLAWKRAWRTAAYWLAAVAGGSALNTVIKVALHRARPGELFYNGWSAFSFPSGHSTVNLILYGFLAFLIARDLRPAWQFAIATSAASFTFLIAFSRLYLGAHWFSDVIGGLAFGTVWLALLGFFYLRKASEPISAKALSLVGCIALTLAGGLNVYRHHALDVGRYAVKMSTPTIPAETWWTTGWRQLPAYRIDLTGEIEEPLTVQWAGSLSGIHEALAGKGWRDPVSWAPRNTLTWLTPDANPAALPVVARLASGRLPDLTVVHEGTSNDARLVLRLWSADLDIAGGISSQVWIGSVVEERVVRSVSLFSWAQVRTEANAPRDVLAGQFPMGRLAMRDGMTAANWDGRVLLLRQ